MSDIGTAYVQIEPTAKGLSKKIEGEMSTAGASGGKTFGSAFSGALGGIGKVVAGVGKAAAGALAVGTTAVAGLAKSSVDAYKDYEQLVGGVQKLYGNMGQSLTEYAQSVGKSVSEAGAEYYKLETAQNMLLKNAQDAYKTAGMSANEYMETATSFSAALINSLGGDTVEAAKQTDVAMRAISDNVNTFGSDMNSVTNAFQGFAKGQYNMLDNLKLGYGGTKEEMQKLIKDANEWGKANGKASNLSIDSFADVVTAIQQIQEKQNIAGTTSREAMKTIEGSMTATKAAWANLVTAIGSGEGIETAFSNLSSVILGENEGEGLLNQILPRVQTVLDGIGSFIEQAAPTIMEKLPPIIQSFLPSLLTTVTSMIQTLVGSLSSTLPEIISIIQSILPDVINAILTAAPLLTNAAVQLITALLQGLVDNMPLLVNAALEIVNQLAMGLIDSLPILVEGVVQLIVGLAAGLGEMMPILIPALVNGLMVLAQALIDNLPVLINGLIQLMTGIANGIIAALPIIIEKLPEIFVQLVIAIVENAPVLIQAVFEIIGQMAMALLQAGGQLLSNLNEVMNNLYAYLKSFLPQLPALLAYYAGQMVGKFLNWITQLPSKLSTVWNNIVSKVKEFGSRFSKTGSEMANKFKDLLTTPLTQLPSKLMQIGKDLINGLLDGIKQAWENLKGVVGDMADSFVKGLKDKFKIGSPSKLMRDEIGRWIPAGIAEGIRGGIGEINDAIDDVATTVITNPQLDALTYGDNVASYETPTEYSVLELLKTYLPIIAQPDNITVGLEPDSARFFKMMQYEAARNEQLVGV